MSTCWGHCPCGVAIPRDRAYCTRCEYGHLRLLTAIAQQSRKDERIREHRYQAAILLRLIALCWFATVVAPTWDHGTSTSTLLAASIGFLVMLLAQVIAPKHKAV